MRILLLLALAMHLLGAPAWAQSANGAALALAPVRLSADAASGDLVGRSLLLRDAGNDADDFPVSTAALPAWVAAHRPAGPIRPGSGNYWLVTSVVNDSANSNWVLSPTNALVERLETRVFDGAGGAPGPLLSTGFEAQHEYMLHYGSNVLLQPRGHYFLVMRLSNRYSVRPTVISLLPQAQMQRLVVRENVIVLGALGALTALAIYNFFLFSVTRRTAYLWYSLFVITYAIAWALPFNLFSDLFDWRMVESHYVPFFLVPVFSTLFYRRFLELDVRAPLLARISRINIVLPLLLLPSCFLAPIVAPRLTTLVMAIYMPLAMTSGVVAWRRGFRPARYFVMGFVALLAPAVPVLLSNIGLLPPLGINLPNLLLLGGTVDALLLGFALADQIRLLGNSMESQVAARTAELVRANTALTAAKEHAEIVSRHRIDFLSAMSHDIRTPLAGIIGMLKLALRDRGVAGRTADYLRIGLSNGEALLVILNDILDYSKIDAGKLTLENTSFHLGRLLDDAVAILQGQAEAKGLLLRAMRTGDLPDYIVGDPTRLRQILVNLLGNAIKFTERGEVLLTVRATAATARGGHPQLVLSVRDTGPGISADMQRRLFQKFEQGDQSTTRKYGGTGLGLAICKELAALMGGSIDVASTPGEGSRFDVTLPLLAAAAPAGAGGGGAGASVVLPHRRRLRILCAEDVSTNQIIIEALLEAMGHAVTVVADGAATLQALAAGQFDLVLMDGRMPGMDGAQATASIRAGAAGMRNARIPIVALTANASQSDRDRYLAAGMDAFLPKPVDEHALYRVIEAVIVAAEAPPAVLEAPAAPPPPPPSPEPPAPPPPPASAEPPAPPDQRGGLAPVAGLSAQQMERVAAAFAAEAPRRLGEAVAALAAQSPQRAADALHALKGSAAYLRSSLVADLAGQLEVRAAAGGVSVGDAELLALQAAVAAAIGELAVTGTVTTAASLQGAPATPTIL